jgi:dihydrofolate reductase
MRTVGLFVHVTANGYFEGAKGDLSWFKEQDEEARAYAQEQIRQPGTILFGHKTFDLMKSFWPTPMAREADPVMAAFMNDMPKFVAARRPFDPGWQNTTVLSGDAVDGVRTLKATPGTPIVILGSNTLCVSLMKAGLVDAIELMVNPVALGEGTPLFSGYEGRLGLSLTSTRQFKSGNLLLTYAPRR